MNLVVRYQPIDQEEFIIRLEEILIISFPPFWASCSSDDDVVSLLGSFTISVITGRFADIAFFFNKRLE